MWQTLLNLYKFYSKLKDIFHGKFINDVTDIPAPV